MKKLGIILFVVTLTGWFLRDLYYISQDNVCSSVRQYACKQQETLQVQEIPTQVISPVSQDKLIELRKISDLFSGGCDQAEVNVSLKSDSYLLIYQSCELEVEIFQEKKWIKSVKINGEMLSKEQIALYF